MQRDQMPKNEAEITEKGHKRLSGTESEQLIKGKNFVGLYRPPFHYVIKFGADGTLSGENNFGTRDNGCWSIDPATGGFTVSWQKYWDDNTAFGYAVDGAIHLFDTQIGDWCTSISHEDKE